MKFDKATLKEAMKLYLVTDRTWSSYQDFVSHVEETLANGVSFLQLREKEASDQDFMKYGQAFKALCEDRKIPFVINDRVDMALAIDADGVHIGQGDMSALQARELLGPDKILGVSVRTVEQAQKAVDEGADYLGVGAVFTTSTKLDASHVGFETLKAITQAVDVPVVAIGGIGAHNVMELSGSGVDGIAVVSAILGQEDRRQATHTLGQLTDRLVQHDMPKVLTIAGSDCSGGAGIQADLKTFAAHKCYGMSVITALTAQNTTGVYGVENCTPAFIENQIDCVFSDIEPGAVKIGMVSSVDIIQSLATKLKEHKPAAVVVDPVMVSTSGSKLLDDDAVSTLISDLIPLATVITPNLSEAEILSGMTIETREDMVAAAKKINTYYDGHILIKGGHLDTDANDLLYTNGEEVWFTGAKIDNPNTHGTGCTLSSAIASNLAKGYSVKHSIGNAKAYLTGAIADKMDLGKGRGPLNHGYKL